MEFPGWPVGKTWCSQCRGLRFVPGQRPKILHPTQCSLKKKKKKKTTKPSGRYNYVSRRYFYKIHDSEGKGGLRASR